MNHFINSKSVFKPIIINNINDNDKRNSTNDIKVCF